MRLLLGGGAAPALLTAHPAGLTGQRPVILEILRAVLPAQALDRLGLLRAHRSEAARTGIIIRHITSLCYFDN